MDKTVRQRVMDVLDGKPGFPVPVFDCYWPEFEANWRALKGDAHADILNYYDIEIRIVAPDESPWPENCRIIEEDADNVILKDGWGRVIRQSVGGYFSEVLSVPIAEKKDIELLDSVVVAEHRADDVRQRVFDVRDHCCVFGKIGGPFLRSSFMRGEEQWLMDMALDVPFARELAERVADHEIKLGLLELEKAELHDTGIWIFDDMASNKGTMFSPATFEEVFLPSYTKMVSALKAAGAKKVMLHSDGNIEVILDMLIEAGIDGINPVEPRSGMDLPTLKDKYGDRLCFVGGLCNSVILPGGDRKEITQHVSRLLEAAKDGGVALGNHSVGPDISIETYEFVLGMIRRYNG